MKLAKGTARILQKQFGDLELIDARENLRLQPMRCDVETAVRKDPSNCVFAKAASRQFGATAVLFWRNSAYVDLLGFDGVRRIERFIVRKDMRELIEAFDRGQAFNEGRAFVLHKPTNSTKLLTLRRQYLKSKKNPKPQARRQRESAIRTYKAAKERLANNKKRLLKEPKNLRLKSIVKRSEQLLPTKKNKMKIAITEAKKAGCKDWQPRTPKTLDVRFGGFGNYNIIKQPCPV
jgi:hypothetical protein